jgi:hypothetical protein
MKGSVWQSVLVLLFATSAFAQGAPKLRFGKLGRYLVNRADKRADRAWSKVANLAEAAAKQGLSELGQVRAPAAHAGESKACDSPQQIRGRARTHLIGSLGPCSRRMVVGRPYRFLMALDAIRRAQAVTREYPDRVYAASS